MVPAQEPFSDDSGRVDGVGFGFRIGVGVAVGTSVGVGVGVGVAVGVGLGVGIGVAEFAAHPRLMDDNRTASRITGTARWPLTASTLSLSAKVSPQIASVR
jgi:hypothetical protein